MRFLPNQERMVIDSRYASKAEGLASRNGGIQKPFRVNAFMPNANLHVKIECRFNAESANVVHMTVRPQDIVDEEDASKGKGLGRDRGDGESTAGCRCVIQ